MRGRRALRLTVLILAAASATGCAGLAGSIEALGKDPTNLCLAVSTPYGSGVHVRANTPGVRVTGSGGNCSIEVTRPGQ